MLRFWVLLPCRGCLINLSVRQNHRFTTPLERDPASLYVQPCGHHITCVRVAAHGCWTSLRACPVKAARPANDLDDDVTWQKLGVARILLFDDLLDELAYLHTACHPIIIYKAQARHGMNMHHLEELAMQPTRLFIECFLSLLRLSAQHCEINFCMGVKIGR